LFPARKFEVFRFSFDNTKIRDLTGFKPESNIRQGVQEAINWLTRQENLAGCKADNIKYLKQLIRKIKRSVLNKLNKLLKMIK
jgi:dTDP-D-glucose 4,6-dehydratase